MIHKRIFLASSVLLISGFCCAQNEAGPQGAPKKDSCTTCLRKDFAGQLLPDFELPLGYIPEIKFPSTSFALKSLPLRCG